MVAQLVHDVDEVRCGRSAMWTKSDVDEERRGRSAMWTKSDVDEVQALVNFYTILTSAGNRAVSL